jgi:methyl-accepting chemotaxis protein
MPKVPGGGRQTKQLPFLQSMRGRLMVLFLALALAPLIVAGSAVYGQAREAITYAALDRLAAVRDNRARQVQMYFGSLDSVLKTLSTSSDVTQGFVELAASFRDLGADKVRELYLNRSDQLNAGDGSRYSTAHARYLPLFKEWERDLLVTDVFLVDTDGNVVFSVAKDEEFGTSLVTGKYADLPPAQLYRMLRAQASPDLRMVDFSVFSMPNEERASFLGRALIAGGQTIGMLIIEVPLSDTDQIMGDRAGLGKTGQAFLVGRDGLMRSDSPLAKESTFLKQKVTNEGVRLAAQGQASERLDVSYRGVPVLAAYAPLSVGGVTWSIVTEIDQNEALAGVSPLTWSLGGIGLATLIVAVLASLALAGMVARRVTDVSDAAGRMAVGDLTKHAPVRGGRDEVSRLASTFNETVDGLSAIVRGIVDSATKLSSGATQISASANEMSAGAESQSMQVIRTSTSMEEMSATIQEVARNARATADASQAAVERARNATARIEAALTGLGQANDSLQELRRRSAEIDRLVVLIADIAAQTNLLALNAAIEAAGAGAAGARFDVVAEEIRKLAQRAAQSTAEIGATVTEIQQVTELAAQRMADTAGQAEGAGQSLSDIVEGIVSISDMVTVITHSADQQAVAAEQVAEALQVITQVSQQTAAAAHETAQTTDDLSLLAQDMRASVQKFKLA